MRQRHHCPDERSAADQIVPANVLGIAERLGRAAGEDTRSRALRALLAFGLALAIGMAAGDDAFHAPLSKASAGAAERPNFVVVTTDDQSRHSFRREVMPETFRLMKNGTSFKNGLAAPPLCCPSRAGFLTAQYPHNHLVVENRPGYSKLKDPGNTLPVWLDRAGYRTGFVGKYLNGASDVLGTEAAPGWDYWYAIHGEPRYFGPTVTRQGEKKTLSKHDYLTTQLNRQALKFLKTGGDKPFFLWLAEYAPHIRGQADSGYCRAGVPEPLPEDIRAFRDADLPKAPSYNERNVNDKPAFIQKLDRLSQAQKRMVERNYRCTLATMQEVDRGVGLIAERLKQAGELDNTIFVFTSDNGVFFGEHRITKGKSVAYEEALRVPLAIRAGKTALGGPAVDAVDAPVAQIDLAPTFLELAGAEACAADKCRRMDGRSIAGLLRGEDAWMEERGILAEAQGMAKRSLTETAARSLAGACGFAAIRTREDMFSIQGGERVDGRCPGGSEEYYDLPNDPFELRNRIDRPASEDTVDELRERLGNLRTCSGVRGRDALLPGRTFCE